MHVPRIYADFHNLDDSNRLRLNLQGTLANLARHKIVLREGLVLAFYMDDADDEGHPDELRATGIVHFNQAERCWVAAVDWSALRHASDEKEGDLNSSAPFDSALPQPSNVSKA